jgi:murein DD-endopeptidase MepM/ murein hydrolase activator NlpD
MRLRLDTMTLAGIGLLLLFALQIVRGWAGNSAVPEAPASSIVLPVPELDLAPVAVSGQQPSAVDASWHTTFAPVYDSYFLTQGLHGYSYGHMAIDIAAGKGATIRSPINGVVSSLSVDQWGNTILVLENDRYQVTLYHGDYTVAPGDAVSVGSTVGFESNHGYTMDSYGNLCTNRECGYHTHLNVFDKEAGVNIDPLTLIPASIP